MRFRDQRRFVTTSCLETHCQHSETSFTCLYHKRSSILYCILNQSYTPYSRFKSGPWMNIAGLSQLEQVHVARSSEPTVQGINGSAHNGRAVNVNSPSWGCGSPGLVSRCCTNRGAVWRIQVVSHATPCRWVLDSSNREDQDTAFRRNGAAHQNIRVLTRYECECVVTHANHCTASCMTDTRMLAHSLFLNSAEMGSEIHTAVLSRAYWSVCPGTWWWLVAFISTSAKNAWNLTSTHSFSWLCPWRKHCLFSLLTLCSCVIFLTSVLTCWIWSCRRSCA